MFINFVTPKSVAKISDGKSETFDWYIVVST